MLIALHKNTRTTPAVRAEIAASDETASVLAQRFGVTEQTVYKWKKREVFGDRSHTAYRLQTVLTPAQESVVVQLRRTLRLPLDDLLAVTREFICPHVSRSCLGRCLRRHELTTTAQRSAYTEHRKERAAAQTPLNTGQTLPAAQALLKGYIGSRAGLSSIKP